MQIINLIGIGWISRTRSKAGIIACIILFVGIMAGVLGGMFTFLSFSICSGLSAAGMDWLYFTLMGLLAVLFGTFGSVFNSYQFWSHSQKEYKETAVKQKGIFGALLARELRHFTSSPIYMLNCGLGIILIPMGGVLLLWQSGTVISVLNEVSGARAGCAQVLLCAAICMLGSMNDMAAPSISLGGKSLWLMQSLPVTPWQVLRAKLSMQLLMTGISILFCLICLAFIYPYTVVELFLTACALLAYVLFFALFDLFIGLKMPNLSWTSEITPIKQSACATIALFSGFAYTALVCVGYMLLDGWRLGYAGYTGLLSSVTLVLCALLWYWLKTKGCSRFMVL